MKKKIKTKGFKWTGFLKPVNIVTPSKMTVYRGNFVMELVLGNSFKINSFSKLREKLYKYLDEHGGRPPVAIRVNHRQYEEYKNLFISEVKMGKYFPEIMEFQGVPLLLHMSLFKGFDALTNGK